MFFLSLKFTFENFVVPLLDFGRLKITKNKFFLSLKFTFEK